MATLTISDSTYRRLVDAATARRIPVEQLLDQVVPIGSNRPTALPGSPEWTAAFDAWVASHPSREKIADDSRDAIYGEERD